MAIHALMTMTSSKVSGRAGTYSLLGLGVLALAGFIAVALISRRFGYGNWDIDAQTYQYIALAMGLALVCAGLVWVIPRLDGDRLARPLAIIFVIGLLARLVMFASTPVLEDDWHRYLWDGASVANGVDPYKFAPADAASTDSLGQLQDWSDDPGLARLQMLSEEDYTVFSRINYPYYKTIYPPVAQIGFGLAHLISPFGLNGWRTVLLLIDIVSFVLIVHTLGLYGRSGLWAGLYWWNPVVVLEVFNAGHMDALIVPFLVGALALAKVRKLAPAVIVLAGAAAVKFWPILLAPALVRPVWFKPARLVGLALLFCVVTSMLLWPQLRYVFNDPDQGLVAYSESWRRHAFLFSALSDFVFANAGEPDALARRSVAGMVAAGALLFAWRGAEESERLPAAMLAVTTVLIFLSPTGYPWYQVWIAGLIPFAPRLGFLALMFMAPLYYLRFLLGDDVALYQWGVVPVAFGVPLVCFALSAVISWRRRDARLETA